MTSLIKLLEFIKILHKNTIRTYLLHVFKQYKKKIYFQTITKQKFVKQTSALTFSILNYKIEWF